MPSTMVMLVALLLLRRFGEIDIASEYALAALRSVKAQSIQKNVCVLHLFSTQINLSDMNINIY